MKKDSVNNDDGWWLWIISILMVIIIALSSERVRASREEAVRLEICEKIKEQNIPAFQQFTKVKLRQTGEGARISSVQSLGECPENPISYTIILPEGIEMSVSWDELEAAE